MSLVLLASDAAAETVERTPPNILFVVWDTARADYLGLYGCDRPTTPFLDQWARSARVFENCVSVGSTTVPAHVSMFTGLLPLEHGVTNASRAASDELTMLAETLKKAGYDTYLFSENPKVAKQNHMTQGFDRADHPWSPAYRQRILERQHEEPPPIEGESPAARVLRLKQMKNQGLKTAGPLLEEGVTDWLSERSSDKPFFIFLNYMAAHTPLIPPRADREAVMTPEEVDQSYRVDYSENAYWGYVFRRHEYSERDLELMRLTYAAAIHELDASFRRLLAGLERAGYLDNTIVVLTGDHGEHLGERHLLDHQYSAYEPLLRVPLVLYFPTAVAAGRESKPVTNMDIHRTLLELAGLTPDADSKAVSLLHPEAERVRLGTYTGVEKKRFAAMQRVFANLDTSPWDRELHALYSGPYKLIIASNKRHELYDLRNDPAESENLFERAGSPRASLIRDYMRFVDSLKRRREADQTPAAPLDEEYIERLRAIGYLDDGTDASESPASRPADDKP